MWAWGVLRRRRFGFPFGGSAAGHRPLLATPAPHRPLNRVICCVRMCGLPLSLVWSKGDRAGGGNPLAWHCGSFPDGCLFWRGGALLNTMSRTLGQAGPDCGSQSSFGARRHSSRPELCLDPPEHIVPCEVGIRSPRSGVGASRIESNCLLDSQQRSSGPRRQHSAILCGQPRLGPPALKRICATSSLGS